MYRTTALVTLLVVVGLGGCLAGYGGDATETPTTSRSVAFPAEPAELTTESAKAYVESYERAYRKRAIDDEYDAAATTVRNVQISTQNVSVEKRGDHAFLVTLRYTVGYTTERGDEPVAADRRYVAKYFVNSSTTMRVATPGIDGSALDPIENGTEVGRDGR